MKRKSLILAVTIGVGAATVLGFQNCARSKNAMVTQQTAGSTSTTFKAFCQIVRPNSDTIVCIDLMSDLESQARCSESGEVANYSAQGANSMFFYRGSDVDCAKEVSAYRYGVIGNCLLPDRVIRYYSNAWSTADA